MATLNLTQFVESLRAKRAIVQSWLENAPATERRGILGPVDEDAVAAHLQALDVALEKTEHGTIGQCEVCDGQIETELLEMDYNCCICLEHFSDKERSRLEAELELSQTIQQALLPQQTPQIPGIEIAAFSRPAEIVGGDYFDFSQFLDGATSLAIADVAGHGMASSLLMASLQTAFRTLTPMSMFPAGVLEQLNHYYTHNINFTTFVTMFLGRYDPETGALAYANAGHNPPLLFTKETEEVNRITSLGPTAPAIGLVEGYSVTEQTIYMKSGNILLLYTDGVTEATNSQGEEFGIERVITLLQQASHQPARDIIQAILRSLQQFREGNSFEDDVTVVAWKIQ